MVCVAQNICHDIYNAALQTVNKVNTEAAKVNTEADTEQSSAIPKPKEVARPASQKRSLLSLSSLDPQQHITQEEVDKFGYMSVLPNKEVSFSQFLQCRWLALPLSFAIHLLLLPTPSLTPPLE